MKLSVAIALLSALMLTGCATLTAPLAFRVELPRHGGTVEGTLFPDNSGKVVVRPAK